MTGIFLDQYPKDLATLHDAIARRDAPLLRRTAHTLKSSCAIFAAQPLVELARTLEQLDPIAGGAEAGDLIARLEAEFPALVTVLRARQP